MFSTKTIESRLYGESKDFALFLNSKGKSTLLRPNKMARMGTNNLFNDRNTAVFILRFNFFTRSVSNGFIFRWNFSNDISIFWKILSVNNTNTSQVLPSSLASVATKTVDKLSFLSFSLICCTIFSTEGTWLARPVKKSFLRKCTPK